MVTVTADHGRYFDVIGIEVDTDDEVNISVWFSQFSVSGVPLEVGQVADDYAALVTRDVERVGA